MTGIYADHSLRTQRPTGVSHYLVRWRIVKALRHGPELRMHVGAYMERTMGAKGLGPGRKGEKIAKRVHSYCWNGFLTVITQKSRKSGPR